MHVAATGAAGIGQQRAEMLLQRPVTRLIRYGGQPGRAERRDSRCHQAAAETLRGVCDEPPQSDLFAADIIQAGAHAGPGLHLEPHQLLRHPRLPIEHPHQVRADRNSGTAGRVQEHELLLYAQRDPARPCALSSTDRGALSRSALHHPPQALRPPCRLPLSGSYTPTMTTAEIPT